MDKEGNETILVLVDLYNLNWALMEDKQKGKDLKEMRRRTCNYSWEET